MKLIAHRPFRDERPLRSFNPRSLDGFDGFELDLRSGPDGALSVFHAPILTSRRKPIAGAVKSTAAVLDRLRGAANAAGLVFFDVKTLEAARRIREALDLIDWDAEIAFICWRRDALETLRAQQPNARFFFAAAPLMDGRITRLLPGDFSVFNRFPYVGRSAQDEAPRGQFNQHAIAVWRWAADRMRALVPEGTTGICFHKFFFRPALAMAARAEGLEIAVYGFRSPHDGKIGRFADAIDFAIIDPDLGARPPRRFTRRARVLRRRFRRRFAIS